MIDEAEQNPRHLVVVEFEGGEDYSLQLICPFGNTTSMSLYPTLTYEPWSEPRIPGLPSQDGWPQFLGQIEDGYCSMNAYMRPVFRFRCRGAIIEVCHVASSQCRVEFEAEQVGLEELLDDALITYREGVYPVIFWEEGFGEGYESGLEIEVNKRAPLSSLGG